jgi:hypothetical protein
MRFFIFLFASVLMSTAICAKEGDVLLRVDMCLKSGECNRWAKKPEEWKTVLIPVPEGETCNPHSAVSEGIDYVMTNYPDYHWAGSVCVIKKGKDI